MKSIDLVQAEYYPQVVAYIESNSFGDQLITFRHELKNGHVETSRVSLPEGQWAPLNQLALLRMWITMHPRMRVIGAIPLKNELELLNTTTGRIFYLKLPAHISIRDLDIGQTFEQETV